MHAEIIVFDQSTPCPYLPGRIARMPLRMPTEDLNRAQFDACLEAGDRRSGNYLYRTRCDSCRRCEPLRIDIQDFHPRSTQRRVKRRGDRELTFSVGSPEVDAQRVRMFNRHRAERGLDNGEGSICEDEFAAFLADSCCETFELRFRTEHELVAVALADRGQDSLSAVYCYFDPDYARLSLGTYAVLTQIDLCRRLNLQHLYLGYYVEGSKHMDYKANFRPHERKIEGVWKRFD